jgi:hypothetical protein
VVNEWVHFLDDGFTYLSICHLIPQKLSNEWLRGLVLSGDPVKKHRQRQVLAVWADTALDMLVGMVEAAACIVWSRLQPTRFLIDPI